MPKHQMLINVVAGEECRIAIVADGKLEELYQERASAESHVGNIYKGRVTNVEPSIQAAFIDFGQSRNGFLHISDLHPMYFAGHDKEETEMVGQKTPRRDRPPIQKCLRRGQEILVQVLKEGIGTKGPTLTSYLSIPGRYLVMMPSMERLGVSRKVEDDDARREMRRILDELNPPQGFGFIIRTAGIGRNKTELKRDLAYLQRLWSSIEARKKSVNVGELFAESDLVVRTIRDVFSSDIEQIIVDDETAAKRARDFLAIANPRSGSQVALYQDAIPLFHRFDIERQIENINARVVPLPSGGSLVIDSTEALVAIDVNSGKMRDNRDAETTAFKANMEAADEICRQLRLRDLGGVIVNDLIDMRDLRHRRLIEGKFRDNLKRDRARTRVSPISQFGILEMTRQRMRPSLRKSIYIDCPHCEGAAQVKSPESVVLDVTRRLALVMHRTNVARVELTVSPGVAFQLLNRKRAQLVSLESQHNKTIMVRVNDGGPADFVSLIAFDERGGQVEAESLANMGPYQLLPVEAVKGKAVVYRDDLDEEAGEDVTAPNAEAQEDEDAAAYEDRMKAEEVEFTSEVQEQIEPTTEASDEEESAQDAGESPQQNAGEEGEKKRKRRRRRGGRGRSKRDITIAPTDTANQPSDHAPTADGPQDHAPSAPTERHEHSHAQPWPLPVGELLPVHDHHAVEHAPADHESSEGADSDSDDHGDHTQQGEQNPQGQAPKRRRRRRGGKRRGGGGAGGGGGQPNTPNAGEGNASSDGNRNSSTPAAGSGNTPAPRPQNNRSQGQQNRRDQAKPVGHSNDNPRDGQRESQRDSARDPQRDTPRDSQPDKPVKPQGPVSRGYHNPAIKSSDASDPA